MEGGILEEMQPTPGVFQLTADQTCPTVEKKKKKNQGLIYFHGRGQQLPLLNWKICPSGRDYERTHKD